MSEISVGNAPSVVTKKAGVFARAKASIKRSVAVLNTKTARTVFRCVGMPLAVFLASRGVAQADDLMTAGRKDAEETFGEGSTMMYYIMLAEVVLVFLLYLRNHNPATFLFIPVFFVVTTVIFAILDSRAGV